MSLHPTNNKVSLISCWPVPILSSCDFLDYEFVCCLLTCLCSVRICCIALVCSVFVCFSDSIVLGTVPFPFASISLKAHVSLDEKSCLLVHLSLLSVLYSVGFWYLIPQVVFHWYGRSPHEALQSCDIASSFCHSYFVASFLVVFCFKLHYGSMRPWSPSSHWNATINPVGRKKDILCIFTYLYTPSCLFITTVWLLPSLLHTIDDLLHLGSMPLDGLLNRNVVRLGSLGLIVGDPICSKNMHFNISFMAFLWFFLQNICKLMLFHFIGD